MTGSSSAPAGPLERFAAHVAHDFNNLLTGILGNLELLQYRAARNNVQGLDGYLEGASSAGGRAAAFAQRLLLFSGRGARPPEAVPVDALLRRLGGNAVLCLAAGGAALFCDPEQIALALTELLDNAAAATALGGEIFLDSALEHESVILRVRDTGAGMAPGILAQAQEPFFTTHASGAGRGLGLSIAARIIAQAGGRMEIQSEEGAGCTVTLTLPRAKS